MKKLLFTVVFTLTVFVVSAVTPKLPPKCEAGLPEALSKPIIKESVANRITKLADFGQSNKIARYWIVYSDRAENNTYEQPSANSPKCTTLGFNETVRIAKIQNGFALVYTEPLKSATYPQISKDAVCKGWVPMKNLLLWQSCLANEKGIYNKALLCVNLDKSSKDNTKDIGVGYTTPSKDVSQQGRLESGMRFYFIMKKENGMALLAQQSKMEGAYSDKVLVCWVADNSYVPWNQRSCLEPTWEYEDAEYFAAKNIEIDIYKNNRLDADPKGKVVGIPFSSRKAPEGPKRLYIHRMDGQRLRFPILDNGTDKVYNISTFATQENDQPDAAVAQTQAEDIKRETLEKMRNINLAIVIDGTTSMKPYYAEVKEAIKKGCEYFNENARIKVGVVIYRDYADGNALTEVLPLTSIKSIDRINQFLDNGGKNGYGIKSAPSDKTAEEALYYGINKALDTLRFRDGESNMMLVVGDCGNDKNDKRISQDVIIKKLVNKKISIMGFQVQNKREAAYDAFNTQLTAMIRVSLTNVYKNLDSRVNVMPRMIKDGFDYKTNTTDNFYFGRYLCAEVNVNDGKMGPGKLSSLMVDQISSFSETVETRISAIIGSSTGFVHSKPEPGMYNLDSLYVADVLGEDYARLLKEANAIVNFRGYVYKKDATDKNYFKPVIFIAAEEFSQMIKSLENLYRVAMSGQYKDRKSYVDAIKALVKGLEGGMTDAEINKLSNAEITAIIGGLNEAPTALKNNYTVEDLTNEQVLPTAEYMKIVRDFRVNYETLSNIKSDRNYKYVREFNGSKYYWLPIENLP